MYSVDRGAYAYCTDCHGMGYTDAINRSMLALESPGSGGPSVQEHYEAGMVHPHINNTADELTQYTTYPTNGCANDRACHGEDASGNIGETQATMVPGYPDGTYDVSLPYYPNPSQCATCHTYENNNIPTQKGHNNLLGCKYCHGEYHYSHNYEKYNSTTQEGTPGYEETHEYAQTCYEDCHTVQDKHCEVIACSECHIGFDTQIMHYEAKVYSNRKTCGECHQSKGNITEHDKRLDINNLVIEIPDPRSMGGNSDGDDWFDNETGDAEWYYFLTNAQSCRYCHGRVFNEPDGKGRVTFFMGDNTKNSTINGTNNWCSGCHVDSYISGSKDYDDMVAIYNSTVGLVPPEITGNSSAYAPGKYYNSTRAGYENHNDSESPSYTNNNFSDAKCFECHGGSLDIMGGMKNFMHNSSNYSETVGPSAIAFAIGMPAQDCTEGKGSTDAGVTCNRCWFETTDTTGYSDETQVACEGQNSTVSFYVFDNQGDVNITWTMKLDSNIDTAKLRHKVSQISGGYEATCSGDSKTGCVYVESTTPSTIAENITAGGGTNDAEAWAWADFISALASDTDSPTLTHTSSET